MRATWQDKLTDSEVHFRVAQKTYERACTHKALTVYLALQNGLSNREIAQVLRTSRQRVYQLAQRGAEIIRESNARTG